MEEFEPERNDLSRG